MANATAGVKLVTESFRDQGEFWYGYHADSHTSLIGVRETATQHRCFATDTEVDEWIVQAGEPERFSQTGLFAYPAQSNMNGRRLPLNWSRRIREHKQKSVYTLLDAASLVSTTPLDLSIPELCPDFIVLSLYKIFGFPDLGALIVQKESGKIFDKRRFFGGGTVEMVVCLKEQWHAKKSDTLHDRLEDGTLPIHSIIALDAAMTVHQELFGSLENISRHTAFLAAKLYEGLSSLRHCNDLPVCQVYKNTQSTYGDPKTQGPIIAFNIRNHLGGWVSNSEFEKISAVKEFHIRTGGLCNPGGVAASLELAPWEMRENFSAGQRCGTDGDDIIRGKPTGMIRVSLGAMSTLRDVSLFVEFLKEFFVQDAPPASIPSLPCFADEAPTGRPLRVESLSIYPIKSCAAWAVPAGKAWEVRPEGLAWDREWCLVHQGTGAALSQKRYPLMALIRPSIDLDDGVLRVRVTGPLLATAPVSEISIPLSADPRLFSEGAMYKCTEAKVCGEAISAKTYISKEVSDFFSQALGVPCHLARFPAVGRGASAASSRHSKAHLQKTKPARQMHVPGAFPETRQQNQERVDDAFSKPILLSNESPILTISRSSLNRLNEIIKAEGGKAAQAEVFRANIVVAENPDCPPGAEQPYAEDEWRYLRIGQQYFELLGPCRRCQMVCIDQNTAERNQEPFVTLSKTRRVDGKVYFGEHSCHLPMSNEASLLAQNPTISVGDVVRTFTGFEAEEDAVLRSLVR